MSILLIKDRHLLCTVVQLAKMLHHAIETVQQITKHLVNSQRFVNLLSFQQRINQMLVKTWFDVSIHNCHQGLGTPPPKVEHEDDIITSLSEKPADNVRFIISRAMRKASQLAYRQKGDT